METKVCYKKPKFKHQKIENVISKRERREKRRGKSSIV
jgi:hypothetical protein